MSLERWLLWEHMTNSIAYQIRSTPAGTLCGALTAHLPCASFTTQTTLKDNKNVLCTSFFHSTSIVLALNWTYPSPAQKPNTWKKPKLFSLAYKPYTIRPSTSPQDSVSALCRPAPASQPLHCFPPPRMLFPQMCTQLWPLGSQIQCHFLQQDHPTKNAPFKNCPFYFPQISCCSIKFSLAHLPFLLLKQILPE